MEGKTTTLTVGYIDGHPITFEAKPEMNIEEIARAISAGGLAKATVMAPSLISIRNGKEIVYDVVNNTGNTGDT